MFQLKLKSISFFRFCFKTIFDLSFIYRNVFIYAFELIVLTGSNLLDHFELKPVSNLCFSERESLLLRYFLFLLFRLPLVLALFLFRFDLLLDDLGFGWRLFLELDVLACTHLCRLALAFLLRVERSILLHFIFFVIPLIMPHSNSMDTLAN